MKIEIGESLALSYLKHVKKCTIYQTNWKISSQWTKLNEKAVKEAFNKINEYDAFKNVFPNKNLAIEVRLEQILKQAEIDILGMNQEEKKIYAMDVAFHKDGLRYSSSSEETKENLIKKSLSSSRRHTAQDTGHTSSYTVPFTARLPDKLRHHPGHGRFGTTNLVFLRRIVIYPIQSQFPDRRSISSHGNTVNRQHLLCYTPSHDTGDMLSGRSSSSSSIIPYAIFHLPTIIRMGGRAIRAGSCR